MNIVLYEPEMPANTGNIGRTCVATNTKLHLIEPLGFKLSEKHLVRAGLDYWDKLDVTVYSDYQDFLKKNPGAKIYMATTKGEHVYTDVPYDPDAYIMFGPESRGIPEQSVEHHAAYKGKPDHIGNDEPFAKGDQVVQTAVHGEIVGCGEKLFRICKHQKEDGPEAEQPQVVQTQIAQPECAVGHVVSHEKIPPDHQIRTQIIAKSFQNV